MKKPSGLEIRDGKKNGSDMVADTRAENELGPLWSLYFS